MSSMLNKSDMVHWNGPIPSSCNFTLSNTEEGKKEIKKVIEEYKGVTKHPWVKRKLLRFLPACMSGLEFSLVCVCLGMFFQAFLYSSNLFLILITVWFVNDLYCFIKKKPLFEDWKKVFVGRPAPEEDITLSILSFKTNAVFKQYAGYICFL